MRICNGRPQYDKTSWSKCINVIDYGLILWSSLLPKCWIWMQTRRPHISYSTTNFSAEGHTCQTRHSTAISGSVTLPPDKLWQSTALFFLLNAHQSCSRVSSADKYQEQLLQEAYLSWFKSQIKASYKHLWNLKQDLPLDFWNQNKIVLQEHTFLGAIMEFESVTESKCHISVIQQQQYFEMIDKKSTSWR